MSTSKQPGAFVRVCPKDYRTIKKLATEKGLPVSNWMRMVILEKIAEATK